MNSTVLRYLLFFVLVAGVLSYSPNLYLERDEIIKISLAIIVLLVLVDLLMKRVEGMDDVSANNVVACNDPIRIPNSYAPTSIQQDELLSGGLNYDLNQPNDVLLQKGQFEEQLIGFDKVRKIVDMQRYNYDVQGPGYYLMHNGRFMKDGSIPYADSGEMICESKLNDIENEIDRPPTSPHTHYGKDRGYLNPEPIYR